MRKFIIKHFALYGIYEIKFPFNFLKNLKFSFSSLRAGRNTFNSFILTCFLMLIQYDYFDVLPILIPSVIITFLCIFYGMVYFKIKPLNISEWDLLDDYQKFKFSEKIDLDIEKFQQLVDIKKRLKIKYPKYQWL